MLCIRGRIDRTRGLLVGGLGDHRRATVHAILLGLGLVDAATKILDLPVRCGVGMGTACASEKRQRQDEKAPHAAKGRPPGCPGANFQPVAPNG